MKRREFSNKLLLGGLAGLGLAHSTPAFATVENDEDNNALEQIDRIRLEINNRIITPNGMRILGSGNRSKDVNLNRGYIQNNENRAYIPGISRPTIRQRFRGAGRIGQVYVDTKFIYVRPDPLEDLDFDRATVVHRGISWEIGDLQATDYQPTGKIPYLGDLPVVGELFRRKNGKNKRNLLIVVTPTLVKLP